MSVHSGDCLPQFPIFHRWEKWEISADGWHRLKPVGDVDFGEAVGVGSGSKGVGHLHRGANAVEACCT